MTIKNPITSSPAKFQKVRLPDFSGGINLRDSADRINDNQFQELYNMQAEGNKLISIKWYVKDVEIISGNVTFV